VFDPCIAQGVEHLEPYGRTLESLCAVVRMILANEEVVVTDVTEVNPRLDSVNGITSINAARLVFKILAGYGQMDKGY
jgi:arginase family enzyme